MNQASSLVPADERLTWREICVQFPDEWVVLVDADWVDDHNFANLCSACSGERLCGAER